jgi:hypothetical protein
MIRCPVCDTAFEAHDAGCPVTLADVEEWNRTRTGLVARLLREREEEELDEELLLLFDDDDD